MAAKFDLWQQAYVLASMSGAGSKQQGLPDVLAAELNTTLQMFFSQADTLTDIGQWETVWGPAIFESNPSDESYPDNTMYVAANADQTVYVVGIAGTNPKSKYDVYQEDLDVPNTVFWPDAFPGLRPYGLPGSPSVKPYISAGTALGINNLLDLTDTLKTNQTLLTFLQSLPASKTQTATLIFCGHSLAGALAPTLALALFNPAGGKLSLSNWNAVYVYPTAGPTPGDADFRIFFSSVFPPVSSPKLAYQVWNQNVWNTIDIVPHAWNITMLKEILTLYPASWFIPPLELVLGIDLAKLLSYIGADTGAGPYQQPMNQPLPGSFDKSIPVSDAKSFEDQALYQHTTAYDILLNVQSLSPGSRNQAAFRPAVHAILTPLSTSALF